MDKAAMSLRRKLSSQLQTQLYKLFQFGINTHVAVMARKKLVISFLFGFTLEKTNKFVAANCQQILLDFGMWPSVETAAPTNLKE